jgi:hypothetical protein
MLLVALIAGTFVACRAPEIGRPTLDQLTADAPTMRFVVESSLERPDAKVRRVKSIRAVEILSGDHLYSVPASVIASLPAFDDGGLSVGATSSYEFESAFLWLEFRRGAMTQSTTMEFDQDFWEVRVLNYVHGQVPDTEAATIPLNPDEYGTSDGKPFEWTKFGPRYRTWQVFGNEPAVARLELELVPGSPGDYRATQVELSCSVGRFRLPDEVIRRFKEMHPSQDAGVYHSLTGNTLTLWFNTGDGGEARSHEVLLDTESLRVAHWVRVEESELNRYTGKAKKLPDLEPIRFLEPKVEQGPE